MVIPGSFLPSSRLANFLPFPISYWGPRTEILTESNPLSVDLTMGTERNLTGINTGNLQEDVSSRGC